MLKEAADEPLGWERGGAGGIGFGVAVPECDLAVFDSEDVSVGDGHAEDIGGEVFQGGLAASYGDDIHYPVLAPEFFLDMMKQTGLFEQISELGAEDQGQGLFGQEIFMSSGSPCVAVW